MRPSTMTVFRIVAPIRESLSPHPSDQGRYVIFGDRAGTETTQARQYVEPEHRLG